MTPPTLRRRIVGGITITTLLTVAALTAALLALLHARVHDQVDRMLLQLAQQDAQDVLHEDDEGIHVHDSPFALPTVRGTIAEKYALIFDDTCEVVAHTRNVTLGSGSRASCAGDQPAGTHGFRTVSGLTDELLHVVSLVGEGPDGRSYTFVVGIRHSEVDRALWETTMTAIPLSLLAVLLIVGTAWLTLRKPIDELTRVTGVCADLEASTGSGLTDAAARFGALQVTSRETAQLRQTLQDLLSRVSGMMRRQEQFIAEAAHELRTPLTALRGEIEVTLRRERTPKEYHEALTWAQGDVERLVTLAEQLLTAARSRSDVLVGDDVVLRDLVEEVMEMHRAELGAQGIAVQLDVSPDVVVRANRVALGQVISNLVANTIQHAGAARLTVSLSVTGETRSLVVHDDGRGVPEDQVDGLFEPFHHDVRSQGHGLGLYIANDLVGRMGSALRYEGSSSGARWVIPLP